MKQELQAEIRIQAKSARTAPPYHKTARELLDRCRSFYEDPENEKAFQEWKAQRSGKHERKAV